MTASRLCQAAISTSIAAIAAAALVFGAQIALFNAEVARVDAAAAAAVPDPGTRTRWVTTDAGPAASELDKAAVLADWQATPGVGGTARLMISAREEGSRAQRLLEIARELSIAPTNGAQWLAFADATLRLGYGTDHALRAYDMATLTARREARVMFGRALLVLREWERMPDDRRRAAMVWLAEARWFGKEGVDAIRMTLSAKSPAARGEISASLPPALAADRNFVKEIGL